MEMPICWAPPARNVIAKKSDEKTRPKYSKFANCVIACYTTIAMSTADRSVLLLSLKSSIRYSYYCCRRRCFFLSLACYLNIGDDARLPLLVLYCIVLSFWQISSFSNLSLSVHSLPSFLFLHSVIFLLSFYFFYVVWCDTRKKKHWTPEKKVLGNSCRRHHNHSQLLTSVIKHQIRKNICSIFTYQILLLFVFSYRFCLNLNGRLYTQKSWIY